MDGLELYVRMCFLRHFEERVDVLYRQGLIHGPAHLGLGQEAIAAGAASVLRPLIAAEEAFSDLAAPVARVSGGNVPLPVAASLEAEVDVSAARVVAAARAVLNYR
jgi:hypothetical protein